MAIIFVIRSFYGDITIPRTFLLIFGSFLLGVFVTNLIVEMLNIAGAISIIIISIPFMFFGLKKPKQK